MGGFESLEKQKIFGIFIILAEIFVGKKKLGLELGVQEDVELWLVSRNVWLKSEMVT